MRPQRLRAVPLFAGWCGSLRVASLPQGRLRADVTPFHVSLSWGESRTPSAAPGPSFRKRREKGGATSLVMGQRSDDSNNSKGKGGGQECPPHMSHLTWFIPHLFHILFWWGGEDLVAFSCGEDG